MDLAGAANGETGGTVDAGAVELQTGEAVIAVDDTITVTTGAQVTFNAFANDIDLVGTAQKFANVSTPEHGSVVSGSLGSLTYTPDEDYLGTDEFTYILHSNSGVFSTATVTVSVVEIQGLKVTTAQDIVDEYDGLTSLREAIDYANSIANGSDPDRITFDSEVFFGDGQPVIRLTEGTLAIIDAVIIDASSTPGGLVTISGDAAGDDVTDESGITNIGQSNNAGVLDDNSQIFLIDSSAVTAQLENLVLTGGVNQTGNGGAISSSADLTLTNTTVSGNATRVDDASGGGLITFGGLTLLNSTVSGNATFGSGAEGGGLRVVGGSLTTYNSTVSGNTSYAAGGGGIHLDNDYQSNLVNSTITGNRALGSSADGGGLRGGIVTLNNTLIIGNYAQLSGNNTPETQAFNQSDSLIGDGIDPDLVFAETIELLDAGGSGTGVFAGVLAGNGGPVETVMLKVDPDNPALDIGAPNGPLLVDARGETRNVDLQGIVNGGTSAAVDAGAVELQDNESARAVDDEITVTSGGQVSFNAFDNDIVLQGYAGKFNNVSDPEHGSVVSGRFGALTYEADEDYIGSDEFTYILHSNVGAFSTATVRVTVEEAPSLVVDTVEDIDDAFDGMTSLREALEYAKAGGVNAVTGNAAEITFDASVFDESDGQEVITLGDGGQFQIDSGTVTIIGDADGDGESDVTISGDDQHRIFEITEDTTSLDLEYLTLTNALGPIGGAIRVDQNSSLVLSQSTITNNTAVAGGAIYSSGTVRIENSTISENTTNSHGGGILNTGDLEIFNSTLSGNYTPEKGAAIYSRESLYLSNVTIAGNTTNYLGGAIYTGDRNISLINSTISGNKSDEGALYIRGFADYFLVINTIIIGNDGGNISGNTSQITNGGGNIYNSGILPEDVFAEIDQTTGGGLLADNGGPVQTIRLLAADTNPALDVGSVPFNDTDTDGIADPDELLLVDAVGNTREVDLPGIGNDGTNTVDAGAVEVQLEADSLVVTTHEDVVDFADGVTSLREALTFALAGGETGDTSAPQEITFDETVFSGGQIITLTQGQLDITGGNISIDGDADGDGEIDVTVSGDDRFRVVNITGNSTHATLQNVTISDGNSRPDGGGIFVNRGAELTVLNSVIRDNYAEYGGAIGNAGTVVVANSTIYNNGAFYEGGGIFGFGNLSLVNSTITGNTTTKDGGGIAQTGGFLELQNTTITGNTAEDGGSGFALLAGSSAVIQNSIILGNSDSPNEEILLDGASFRQVGNSIIGGSGLVASEIFAEIDLQTGGGLLSDNGGPVPTVRLRESANNPALDIANVPQDSFDADGDGITAEDLPVDANGNPRDVAIATIGRATTVDAGAVELQQSDIDAIRAAILEDSASPDGNSNADGVAVTDDQLSLVATDVFRFSDNDGNAVLESRFQSAVNAVTDFSNLPTTEEVQAVVDEVSTDLSRLFVSQSSFNDDYVIGWDVSQVENMNGIFFDALVFNQDISDWIVSSVTDFSNMFGSAHAFNQDVGNWDVSSAFSTEGMFVDALVFDQDISRWDMSNVTNTQNMFNGARAFNQDIGSWQTGNVTNMRSFFADTNAFNQDLSDWDVSNVTDMVDMFTEASAFDQDISKWNVESLTAANAIFDNSGMSVENFDKVLAGWATIDHLAGEAGLNNGVTFGETGRITYSDATARNHLESVYGWNVVATLDAGIIVGTNDADSLDFSSSTAGVVIHALDGTDTVIGSTLGDTIVGGEGDDNLTGGAGADTFVYKFYNAGDDTITDFDLIEDRIDLGQLILGFEDGVSDIGSYVTVSASSEGNVLLTIDRDGADETGETALVTIELANIGYDLIDPDTFVTDLSGGILQFDTTALEAALAAILEDSASPSGASNADGVAVTEEQLKLAATRVLGSSDTATSPMIARYQAAIQAEAGFTTPLTPTQVQAVIDAENRDLRILFSDDATFNEAYVVDWDVSQVVSMNGMFADAESFNQNIGNWDVSNVEDMTALFIDAINFNQDIGRWDVSNVAGMGLMFAAAANFNQDIGDWNVGNVTSMELMFFDASSFNQNIGAWNVGSVSMMDNMFANAITFNQDIGDWDVSSVTNMRNMFQNAAGFDQDIGDWDISSLIIADNMLSGSAMSIENFDKLLAGWATLSPDEGQINSAVILGAGELTYSDATSFNHLEEEFSWFIRSGSVEDGVIVGQDRNTTSETLGSSAEISKQIIHGLGGDDILIGGSGSDELVGGAGSDVMTGGAGADSFVIRFYSDSYMATDADTITDFSAEDVIVLANTGFSDLDAVLAGAVDVSGAARITFDNGFTLQLTGFSRDDLTADNFVFL
ncbi:BspA family leucine-rich repeat surface protein [Roseibium sp. RKSG952]|uniref:BspA family leucine-rich repeat surface protein n=1 Tax=Roseibium sp. RKSG952 TaxID=2529384 RepID=UPI001AD8D001